MRRKTPLSIDLIEVIFARDKVLIPFESDCVSFREFFVTFQVTFRFILRLCNTCWQLLCEWTSCFRLLWRPPICVFALAFLFLLGLPTYKRQAQELSANDRTDIQRRRNPRNHKIYTLEEPPRVTSA